jgi:hypothetical protein
MHELIEDMVEWISIGLTKGPLWRLSPGSAQIRKYKRRGVHRLTLAISIEGSSFGGMAGTHSAPYLGRAWGYRTRPELGSLRKYGTEISNSKSLDKKSVS